MIVDVIKYNNKEYQISTVYIKKMYTYETMIFPIENNKVSGDEIYCFRTMDGVEAINNHKDIFLHIEKYVSDEAIMKYINKKKYSETIERWIEIWDGSTPDGLPTSIFIHELCEADSKPVKDPYPFCPYCGKKITHIKFVNKDWHPEYDGFIYE